MRTVLAYVLVIPLVQFPLTIGVGLGGLPIALALAWASNSVRSKIAGVFAGVAGVALAVAFGYGVFRFVVGPGSFTIGPFMASTLPLLLPIRNDYIHSRMAAAARERFLETLAGPAPVEVVAGDRAARLMAEETQASLTSGVVGEVIGLVLAVVWFVSRR